MGGGNGCYRTIDMLQVISLTCCSSPMMTSTAIFRIPSFVCGLSDERWDIQILPSSFSASLMSRILIRCKKGIDHFLLNCIKFGCFPLIYMDGKTGITSLALFADLRSFSRSCLISGGKWERSSSSSLPRSSSPPSPPSPPGIKEPNKEPTSRFWSRI